MNTLEIDNLILGYLLPKEVQTYSFYYPKARIIQIIRECCSSSNENEVLYSINGKIYQPKPKLWKYVWFSVRGINLGSLVPAFSITRWFLFCIACCCFCCFCLLVVCLFLRGEGEVCLILSCLFQKKCIKSTGKWDQRSHCFRMAEFSDMLWSPQYTVALPPSLWSYLCFCTRAEVQQVSRKSSF